MLGKYLGCVQWSYAVVAVLRMQDKTHRRRLLRPWVHTVGAKEQGEVFDATESILEEIPGFALQGMPFEGRVLRMQTDRSTEGLNASFRDEMKKRNLVTQGYSLRSHRPQSGSSDS